MGLLLAPGNELINKSIDSSRWKMLNRLLLLLSCTELRLAERFHPAGRPMVRLAQCSFNPLLHSAHIGRPLLLAPS